MGRFPPLILGPSLYACPTCWSPNDEQANTTWGTRNGYKYHLAHVCLGNPGSKRSMRMRAAAEAGLELVPVARKKDVLRQCGVCEAWFKSEAGYKSHREMNVTTRHGLCRTKGWRGRGLVEGQAGPSSPVVEMGDQQMAHEVPQMVPYEMGADPAMPEFQASGYFAWEAAWMAFHGNAEHSMTEEPEAEAQMEAEG
jgi:hypothetical protein